MGVYVCKLISLSIYLPMLFIDPLMALVFNLSSTKSFRAVMERDVRSGDVCGLRCGPRAITISIGTLAFQYFTQLVRFYVNKECC